MPLFGWMGVAPSAPPHTSLGRSCQPALAGREMGHPRIVPRRRPCILGSACLERSPGLAPCEAGAKTRTTGASWSFARCLDHPCSVPTDEGGGREGRQGCFPDLPGTIESWTVGVLEIPCPEPVRPESPGRRLCSGEWGVDSLYRVHDGARAKGRRLAAWRTATRKRLKSVSKAP